MDLLWPEVNVTEASLQRLVSLARRALEPGGFGEAIRSYVRHGYRFAADQPRLVPPAETAGEASKPHTAAPGDSRAAALAAVERRDWAAAIAAFEAMDAAGPIAADDIDIWALATECTGRPAAAIPILTRAVAAHVSERRPHMAARDAVTLAKLELERSAAAAASGWMGRAEALMGPDRDPRTVAYFLWMKSRMASFGGRPEEALQLAAESLAAATESDNDGLIALALTYHGFFRMALGRMEEGVGDQNHAAAIALSSGVDPVIGSTIYCNILWACRTFPDWTRARQWSQGFETWCSANYAQVPGTCDLHRAEVLGSQRDLGGALLAIEEAIPKLTNEESWAIGDAYRVRGDIRAMVGDLAGARADYSSAYAVGWDAEPGNAILLAEAGETTAALQALDRALAGTSWYHLQRQGQLLANKARIAAQGGRRDIAERTVIEIDARPELAQLASVRALVCETHWLLDQGESEGAIRHLLLARQLWRAAGIEYQEARVRLDLAEVFLAMGDPHGAETEASAAAVTGRRIGSRRLAAAAAAILARLDGPGTTRSGNDRLKISAR